MARLCSQYYSCIYKKSNEVNCTVYWFKKWPEKVTLILMTSDPQWKVSHTCDLQWSFNYRVVKLLCCVLHCRSYVFHLPWKQSCLSSFTFLGRWTICSSTSAQIKIIVKQFLCSMDQVKVYNFFLDICFFQSCTLPCAGSNKCNCLMHFFLCFQIVD